MSLITEALLIRADANRAGAALYAGPLAAACDARNVATQAEIRVLLANVLNESGGLTRISEDLDYLSGIHIHETFPTALRGWSASQLAKLINNPVALGNTVYKSLGGYVFRGLGLGQITGRANQGAYAADIGKPLAEIGEYLLTPMGAADSAVWFFVQAGCRPLAAAGNLLEARRRWAGCHAPAMPEGWVPVQKWHGQVSRAMGSSVAAFPVAATLHAGSGVAVASVAQPAADALMTTMNPVGV